MNIFPDMDNWLQTGTIANSTEKGGGKGGIEKAK